MVMLEEAIEADLPIVDPHQHIWDLRPHVIPEGQPADRYQRMRRRFAHYMFDQALETVQSGHNVRATIYVECDSMHRRDGPRHLRFLGETEFANGAAAASASGMYGDLRLCAGIVGKVEMLDGDRAGAVLDAHMALAPDRFRGVRYQAPWHDDPAVLGPLAGRPRQVYLDPRFRAAMKHLAPRGLSFDAWLLGPQLPDLIDLARAFPDTVIILDHVGTPIRSAPGCTDGELFQQWRADIVELAKSPLVNVKLGGLCLPILNFPSFMASPPASSQQLALEWAPYFETCIEAFGPERCMFESNYPVDSAACDYVTLWNAMKLFAKSYGEDEKTALFSGTAARAYRIAV